MVIRSRVWLVLAWTATVYAEPRKQANEAPALRVSVECGDTDRCILLVPDDVRDVELYFPHESGVRPGKNTKVKAANGPRPVTACAGGACAKVRLDGDLKVIGTRIDRDITVITESMLRAHRLEQFTTTHFGNAADNFGPQRLPVPQLNLGTEAYGPETAPVPQVQVTTMPNAPVGTSPDVPGYAASLSRFVVGPNQEPVGRTPEPTQPQGTTAAYSPGPASQGSNTKSVGAARENVPSRRRSNGRVDDRAFSDVVLVGARELHCTGVLVSERVVLTAAHCLPATRVVYTSRADDPVDTSDVAEAHAHPTADIAVLLLSSASSWAPRPMRLPGGKPPVGELVLIGFGLDDPAKSRGFGIKRRVPVLVNGWGCDGARARTTQCDPTREMVIPSISGSDTCNGDSGGPVLERAGGSYRLVAITSRPSAMTAGACGRGGIYTRVDAIADWLDTYIGELK